MKCPICNLELIMSTRENFEIDYCPKCRGVWLDRGELDKIIEKSVASISSKKFESPGKFFRHEHDEDHYHDRKHYKKRKNFLGELFDF